MDLDQLNKIFFLGIGGIGMSALARYFRGQGKIITGYDRVETPLTRSLESEGMLIHYDDDPQLLTSDIDLVIYTPAIPDTNKIFNKALKNAVSLLKRSEVLEILSENKTIVAVAGTHGKTTITSIIAHILKHSGKDFMAFVGGISKNYDSNFISNGSGEIMVVEADEFDRSFLKLKPNIAVISSIDADHLDIYQDEDDLVEAFTQFAKNVRKMGRLIIWHEIDLDIPTTLLRIDYSVFEPADIFAAGIRPDKQGQYFTMISCHYTLHNVLFKVPGEHNIANAMAASSACFNLGLTSEEVRAGLESYLGVSRRFDIRINEENIIYIDDYAHHPSELSACISSVRNLYPGKKITGIFQPHLYSRTRDFADGFAESLSLLDEIILTDIYPAREKPIEGISSQIIFDKIDKKEKILVSKEETIEVLKNSNPEIVLTLGAGDIDQIVKPLEKMLRENFA